MTEIKKKADQFVVRVDQERVTLFRAQSGPDWPLFVRLMQQADVYDSSDIHGSISQFMSMVLARETWTMFQRVPFIDEELVQDLVTDEPMCWAMQVEGEDDLTVLRVSTGDRVYTKHLTLDVRRGRSILILRDAYFTGTLQKEGGTRTFKVRLSMREGDADDEGETCGNSIKALQAETGTYEDEIWTLASQALIMLKKQEESILNSSTVGARYAGFDNDGEFINFHCLNDKAGIIHGALKQLEPRTTLCVAYLDDENVDYDKQPLAWPSPGVQYRDFAYVTVGKAVQKVEARVKETEEYIVFRVAKDDDLVMDEIPAEGYLANNLWGELAPIHYYRKRVMDFLRPKFVEPKLKDFFVGDYQVMGESTAKPFAITSFVEAGKKLELFPNQRKSVEMMAKDLCHVMFGPAGTGKTTTLTHFIREVTKSGARVAVTAHNHVPIDIYCKNFSGKESFHVRMVRYGKDRSVGDDGKPFLPNHAVETFAKRMDERAASEEFRATVPAFAASREAWERTCNFVNKFAGVSEPIQRGWLAEEYKASANLILGTFYQTSNDTFATDVMNGARAFDYGIVDEASMILWFQILGISSMSNRLILAGDFTQLSSHLFDIPPKMEGYDRLLLEQFNTCLEESFLERHYHDMPADRKNCLVEQTRMHEQISKLSNVIYAHFGVRLVASWDMGTDPRAITPAMRFRGPRGRPIDSRVIWDDATLALLGSGKGDRKRNRSHTGIAGTNMHRRGKREQKNRAKHGSELSHSWTNQLEIDVIKRRLAGLIPALPRDKVPQWSIGIITYYADQRLALSTQLKPFLGSLAKKHGLQIVFGKRPNDNDRAIEVHIRTVDSYQGGEADVVFLSLVITHETDFTKDFHRPNVGVTRARYMLDIVGSAELFGKLELPMTTLRTKPPYYDPVLGVFHNIDGASETDGRPRERIYKQMIDMIDTFGGLVHVREFMD